MLWNLLGGVGAHTPSVCPLVGEGYHPIAWMGETETQRGKSYPKGTRKRQPQPGGRERDILVVFIHFM